VNAERAIISVLGATCNQPVAVHCASAEGDHLVLRGFVSDVNGRHCLSARAEGPRGAIDDLVHEVGQSLLADGALELLAQ
jgi:porphobilinogen deaminase